jgi:hypothetical protein
MNAIEVSIEVWDPPVYFLLGGQQEQGEWAEQTSGGLGQRITDLGGRFWRVLEFDTPTHGETAAALAEILERIGSEWRDVITVAGE